MNYLEQQQEGYSIAQRQELLQIAYNEQPRGNINEAFVKVESIIVLWKLCLSVSLDMQTFLKVFQTASIPRRVTPDQVRYHHCIVTQNACGTHLR